METDAPDDGREPRAEVHDGARVGAVQAQPRLLHRVVGFGHRAEHPVGNCAQVGAVALELVRHQISRAHRHLIPMTNGPPPM
jgi:hypothetical protein